MRIELPIIGNKCENCGYTPTREQIIYQIREYLSLFSFVGLMAVSFAYETYTLSYLMGFAMSLWFWTYLRKL